MGEHPVARQKQEALACFLATDPTTIPIPTTEAVIASPAGKGASTLNKSFLAAVVASVARPDTAYSVGGGWEGEHHGGPRLGLYAGDVVSGQALGLLAMDSEVLDGLQGGGREFHGGYAVGVYYVGYLLALRHGSPEVRKLAARALAANLAIDCLLTVPGTGEVIEIGGRATGGPNTYSAVIQRLWAGDEDVRVPESDAAIACQMFEELAPKERAMLPHVPGSVGEAVEILERAKVVCPAQFEWWGWETWWRAQVNRERSWFIDRRTGEKAMLVVAPRQGGFLNPREDARSLTMDSTEAHWHLSLTESGLQVHRRPGGEGKPSPPPRPEPEEPPAGDPDLLDAVRAWAMSPDAPRGVKNFRKELLDRLRGIRGVAK